MYHIKNVWKLPQSILKKALIEESGETENQNQKKLDKNQKILDKYQKITEKEIRTGRNSTFNISNLKGKTQKLRQMIIAQRA